MKPIEKFEWKDNIAKEKDLLKYVAIAEQLYIPDFDYSVDPYYLGYVGARYSAEDIKSVENVRLYVPNMSEAIDIFADRYNDGLIAEHISYDKYMNHMLIQLLLKDLALDADKFWMLLLFAYDYSFNCCIQGIDLGESPNEQLVKFVEAILKNVESFHEKDGTAFAKPVAIKISVEGERGVVIDNPTAIHYIADSTAKMMERDNLGGIGVMRHKRTLDTSTPANDSPFIAFFARLLLDFLDTQPQVAAKRKKGVNHSQKETDLVCQLIAFTRLSTKECWTLERNDTLKAFLKQYKDFKPNAINSVYPTFRM